VLDDGMLMESGKFIFGIVEKAIGTSNAVSWQLW
jgi:hypothetical protein